MAQFFFLYDPAPDMGDKECQWFADNFDVEFEATDGHAHLGLQATAVRVTMEKAQAILRNAAAAKPRDAFTIGMLVRLRAIVQGMEKAHKPYLDFLTWW